MARRRRAKGLLRRTLLGVALGWWAALVTLVSWVYVESTNHPLSAPPGLTFVRTGGYLTRFETWGPPHSAHPIVLVHGAFESVEYWRPVAEVVSRHTHVEAYDLEGYGYTQRVGRYTTEDLATQLDRFLVARHLQRPVLVGHSLGAGVIARFVLDHPHVASGLVFLDGDGLSVSYPGSGLFDWLPDPYRTALYRLAVRNDWFLSTVFHAACGSRCPPVTPQVVAMIRRPLEVRGAQSALQSISSRPIVGVTPAQLREVGRWRIPTLVVFGRNDSSYSPAASYVTARRLRAGRPVLLAGAGHLSLWSRPHAVADLILHLRRDVDRGLHATPGCASGTLVKEKGFLCAAK